MFPGKYYVVYLYVDEVSGRIVATAKINRFLQKTPVDYTLNQEVSLLVTQQTELGFKVIIDNAHWGMIYHNEIFKPVHRGDRLTGYVTHIRADEKVDVALQPVGYSGSTRSRRRYSIRYAATGGLYPITTSPMPVQLPRHSVVARKISRRPLGHCTGNV